MFFSIALDHDHRFPCSSQHGNLFFNRDPGWTQHKVGSALAFFKGYVESVDVNQCVQDLCKNPQPRHKGNFCCVLVQSGCITITHDVDRSFPLYWYDLQQTLTNYRLDQLPLKIYSNKLCSISQQGWLQEQDIVIDHAVSSAQLSLDQCADQLTEMLVKKLQSIDIDRPVNIFVSSGMDTALIMSLLNYCSVPYTEIKHKHFDHDVFFDQNFEQIKKLYWGYRQFHYWSHDCYLASGACGDEFLLRGPYVAGLWCAWNNLNVFDHLTSDCYHWHYFQKPANQKVFEDFWDQRNQIQARYVCVQDLNTQIINVNANDHQHWHYGSTLTMTLFKDLDLTRTVLALNPEHMIQQITSAELNRRIIQRLDPACLNRVSQYKNYNG